MLGVGSSGGLQVRHGDDALPEPFVFGLGVVFSPLEAEDAADDGQAADGEAAVAGEFVVCGSGFVSPVLLFLFKSPMGDGSGKAYLGAAAQS